MEIFASRFEGEDEFTTEQRQETDLMFATCYMSWADKYFDDFEKGDLRVAMANGDTTYVYQILLRSGILDDDQIITIRDCLANRTLRTRFIIRLCAKGLLECLPR